MRHRFGYRKLNKTSEHRKALFKNMLNSLIKYEQIITTLPKAKELKPKIDKVITIGKKSDLNNKKSLFSKLQDKNSVKKYLKHFLKDMQTEKVDTQEFLRQVSEPEMMHQWLLSSLLTEMKMQKKSTNQKRLIPLKKIKIQLKKLSLSNI